ncbi:MAG: phosphatidate cytidylyltransferase [Deltaproteobacteria bacterium]|nr:phosphatidate cytidylyltransferase [Deltaproteobacteria bacterium]
MSRSIAVSAPLCNPVDSKTASRVLTALGGIPVLILVIGWGEWWHFSLLIFLVTAAALFEYFIMAFRERCLERLLGILLGLLLSLGALIPELPGGLPWVGIVIVSTFSTFLFLGGTLEKRYERLGCTLLGMLYIGYLMPHAVLLYSFPDGRRWVFFLLLVIMIGDTAAYAVGRLFGKRKLWPEISPGKTIEGAFGSTASSLMAGLVGGRLLLPGISWLEVFLLSLMLNLLGQIGDLFESWIKRVFSVKDSGILLPGHGGFLDRTDSLIFPLVFATYYVRFFHP